MELLVEAWAVFVVPVAVIAVAVKYASGSTGAVLLAVLTYIGGVRWIRSRE